MTEFSGPQETALMALVGGAAVVEAAQAAGVRRETVSRWLNQDADFAEELRQRRDALWRQYEDRLVKMVGEALDGLYVLTHGPDYYGRDEEGRSFYDPRVRLDAIKLVLLISGLAPQTQGIQINNVLAAQQAITSARSEPDAGRAPIREVNDGCS